MTTSVVRGGARERLVDISAEALLAELRRCDLPVLLFFHADWCRSCRQLLPLIGEFTAKSEGRLAVYGIDVEKEYDLVVQWQIREVPSFLLLRNGKVECALIGITWQSGNGRKVQEWLDTHDDSAEG